MPAKRRERVRFLRAGVDLLLQSSGGGFQSIGPNPALHQPYWMSAAGGESLDRSVTNLVLTIFMLSQSTGELAQHRIHKWSSRPFASAFYQLDALMNGSPGGNATEPAQLINGNSQCSKNP